MTEQNAESNNFIYNIQYEFESKHFNPPFYGDYHSHKFIVNFELLGNISSDYCDSQYSIDTVEFQKHLGRFISTLSNNLNEDKRLEGTSASTEMICLMFLEHYPKYLKEQGYSKLKNILCRSISVYEGYSRETRLIVDKYIF